MKACINLQHRLVFSPCPARDCAARHSTQHPTASPQHRTPKGRDWRTHWMLDVSPRFRVSTRTRGPGSPRSGQRAYLLIETLVYIGVLAALLGVGYSAMYRCIDSSIALRRNADEITSALHAGERWRADVRSAGTQPRLESTTEAGQLLCLSTPHGAVNYRFAANALFRQLDGGPWVCLLRNVKSSTMTADPRKEVVVWRWELELQPRQSGSVKPGRIRPLFTFLAVPGIPVTQ